MQRLRVDPPLDPDEIDFLRGFLAHAGVRRLWPGQPGTHTPWAPTVDGDLALDEAAAAADPEGVAAWLRFLVGEVLAPRTPAAFERILDEGLRCGHRLSGRVVVGDGLVVCVDGHEVRERRLDLVELLTAAAAGGETATGGPEPTDLDAARGARHKG